MPNIFLLSRIFWSSLILCFPLQTGRGLHSLLFAQHWAECMPQSVCPFPQSHCLAHWIFLITRYHAENRNITLGEYKFGPLFMRLCYELDLEDSAVELIKDQVTVSPVAFPATVISLCWGGRVFSDIRKGSSSIHIIPGLDFHREATRLSKRALPCVFKVSLESLPTERGRFLCTEVRTGVEEVQVQIARYPPTLDVRPPGADTLSLEACSVGTVWGGRLSHSSSALLSCFCIFTSGWRLCWQMVFCFQNFCFHIIWFSFPKSRSSNNYFCNYPLNICPHYCS